jgi:hypothetical protein
MASSVSGAVERPARTWGVCWPSVRTADRVEHRKSGMIRVAMTDRLYSAPSSGRSRPFRGQCEDQCWIRTEEKIADGQTPPVGDPSLHQMVRPVVQNVAALTERPHIPQPVVGGIAVEVRRCEYDTRQPEPGCLHKVGPTGGAPTAIPPGRRLFVEPAPVGQAADEGEVGSRQPWHLPPARSKRTWRLSARQCGG